MKLIWKLTLTIGLVLVLIMAPFTYVNLKSLRQVFLEQAMASADNFSETVLRTTHSQMLENDRSKLKQTMREVSKQAGVDHIRMMNKDGTIIFSTDPNEIGAMVDKKASACNMCHSGGKPLTSVSTMNRSRLFQAPEGRELLGLTKAIYNEPSCYTAACHFHPRDQGILGVLDVILSLEPLQEQLAAYRWKTIVTTLVMIALLSGILILFMQQLVHKPVRALLQHTEQVAQGNLDASVEGVSEDELGKLAGAFNHMTQNLKKARAELEDWGRNLETKVEQRTREVKRMQAQLVRSEKLASLGELVAGIAHELNNPLTGILVFSSLLAKNTELDEPSRNDINVIVHETQRCATIVKGLLEFSRESIPAKKPCSLAEIMEKTLSLVGHQSFFHDIEIRKEYAESMPPVYVDPNQIEQVFINMLLNASQAMSGRGVLVLRTYASADGEWACADIEDTGCGIPETHLEKIFDPFFTTKESKGTGLGLSVSYGIVQNHAGRIDVRSEAGVGTTFTVMVPLGEGEPRSQPA